MKKIIQSISVFLVLIGIFIGGYRLYRNQVKLSEYIQSIASRPQFKTSQSALPQAQSRQVSPWVDVQQKVKNTVVQVLTDVSQINWLEPYKSPVQEESRGSAFFINADGHLVTNYHVISQAKNIEIRLPFLGQEKFEAEVVGASPERDIALLKLKKDDYDDLVTKLGGAIPYLSFGDSDEVKRAQDLMALGYPLGQQNVKSTIGNVSGLERLANQYYIQITAPLNPGNSGGPSLNAQGEVIGVNSCGILEAQNVGYIIPINEVKSALKDLYKVKLLRKPTLGCMFTPSTDEMVKYYGNPEEGGWYIAHVFKNTILEKVGVRSGDMLYAVNGYQVDKYGDISVAWSEDKVSLLDLLNRFVVGDQIHLVVYRNGTRHDFAFKLEPRFLLPVRRMFPDFETIDYEVIAGMCVMNLSLNHVAILLAKFPQLSPTLTRYLRPEHQYEQAVVITHVFPDSPAKKTKVLFPGIIIDEVNGQKVTTLDEFRKAVKKSKGSKFLTVQSREDYSFGVMTLEDVIKDEDRLSSIYFYKKSDLLKDLA